jgi:RNA 3'-terminal phosphate cyclase (ATP)
MARADKAKIIKLDGRTGEGGGQLVRVAVGLAALTGTPIQIDNVRGNRGGKKRGGGRDSSTLHFQVDTHRDTGLKAQHVSCIKILAEATGAEIKGCSVGSNAIEFKAKLSPLQIANRNIRVKADSAASVLLVFQAVLPFLVFAADEKGTSISMVIQGGTNVSFSLSFEYLDQVLLPALERFGIKVERKLEFRGWSHGTPQIGSAKFILTPLQPGQALKEPSWPLERGSITKIDVSLLVPREMIESLKGALLFELSLVFPDVDVNFIVVEDSRHNARIYTLLVAHTSTDLRFGRDWLYDGKTKNKIPSQLRTEISQRVVDGLDSEVRKGGVVDEYLQDQLIVFQALAEGKSCIPGTLETLNSDTDRLERAEEPFGDGSMHTKTARWVASEILPQVKWIDGGRLCVGAGWKASDLTATKESLEKVRLP